MKPYRFIIVFILVFSSIYDFISSTSHDNNTFDII